MLTHAILFNTYATYLQGGIILLVKKIQKVGQNGYKLPILQIGWVVEILFQGDFLETGTYSPL